MSEFNPVVIAIVLGAGAIAVLLMRELFRIQKQSHPARVALSGGNPPRSQTGTEDRAVASAQTKASSSVLNTADQTRTGPDRHPPPLEAITAVSSNPPKDLSPANSLGLLNGSKPHSSDARQEASATYLWAALKRERSSQFVSFINFKGGVGKSTLAVEIATSLAKHFGKRVLLIDLDPQTNATFYLMDHSKWQSWQETNGSLKTLFEAYLEGQEDSFHVSQVIKKDLLSQKGASLAPGLELLPSHLGLIQIDVQLAAKMTRREEACNNLAIIRHALQQVQDQYDYILFDCPPHFNLVAQNGLFASDAYVIPAIPDYLSTLGISLIQAEVERFANRIRQDLSNFGGTFSGPELKGIIFTRVRVCSRNPLRFVDLHERRIQEVYRTNPEVVFKNFISEAVRFAEAPERQLPVCLSSRPEDRDARNEFLHLTEEFIERVGRQEQSQNTERSETNLSSERMPESRLAS